MLTSCLNEDHPLRIEKWHLYEYEGMTSCIFSFDSIPEEPNYIIETLLGLEDSTMMEYDLHLGNNGEMKILRDNHLALSGNWNNSHPQVLVLTANGQFWNFEVVSKNEDSLVLRSQGYQFLQDLKIVLRH